MIIFFPNVFLLSLFFFFFKNNTRFRDIGKLLSWVEFYIVPMISMGCQAADQAEGITSLAGRLKVSLCLSSDKQNIASPVGNRFSCTESLMQQLAWLFSTKYLHTTEKNMIVHLSQRNVDIY